MIHLETGLSTQFSWTQLVPQIPGHRPDRSRELLEHEPWVMAPWRESQWLSLKVLKGELLKDARTPEGCYGLFPGKVRT